MKTNLIKLANEESVDGKNLSDSDLQKITELYVSTVTIPKTKPTRQIMLCPVGLVGAGKTTVLKSICDRLGLARISTDEIRHVLKNKGFNYLRAVEVAKKAILKYLEKGYSIGVDGDVIDPEIQIFFKKIAEQYKLKLILIHIKAPEKFILNKLANYKHTWLFKDANDAIDNYNRRKALHKQYLASMKFYYKFDTSKSNLAEQIDKFINTIKEDLFKK
jgi:predicted kinase